MRRRGHRRCRRCSRGSTRPCRRSDGSTRTTGRRRCRRCSRGSAHPRRVRRSAGSTRTTGRRRCRRCSRGSAHPRRRSARSTRTTRRHRYRRYRRCCRCSYCTAHPRRRSAGSTHTTRAPPLPPPLPPLLSWLGAPTPPLSWEHAHHGTPPRPPLHLVNRWTAPVARQCWAWREVILLMTLKLQVVLYQRGRTTWAVAEHSPGHSSAGGGARRRDKWYICVGKSARLTTRVVGRTIGGEVNHRPRGRGGHR